MAASLLGMLLFLRIDMVIAVAGFVGAAALGRMAGLPAVVGFFPALVVWLAAAAIYLLGLMKPYMAMPLVWLAGAAAVADGDRRPGGGGGAGDRLRRARSCRRCGGCCPGCGG